MLKTVYIGKYLWLMECQTDSRVPVVMLDRRPIYGMVGISQNSGQSRMNRSQLKQRKSKHGEIIY